MREEGQWPLWFWVVDSFSLLWRNVLIFLLISSCVLRCSSHRSGHSPFLILSPPEDFSLMFLLSAPSDPVGSCSKGSVFVAGLRSCSPCHWGSSFSECTWFVCHPLFWIWVSASRSCHFSTHEAQGAWPRFSFSARFLYASCFPPIGFCVISCPCSTVLGAQACVA
jgi:hypothetical protein